MEKLKQTVLEMEELIKGFKIKELGKEIKTSRKETHLVLQSILKDSEKKTRLTWVSISNQRKENEILHNQIPLNTLIEDMEKLGDGFFTNGYFTLGEERNRFSRNSSELAKLVDKIRDK